MDGVAGSNPASCQGFAIGAHDPGNAVAGTGADPPSNAARPTISSLPQPVETRSVALPRRERYVSIPASTQEAGEASEPCPDPPRLRTGSCAEPSARAATRWHRFPLGSAREAAHQDAFPSSWRPPPGPRQSGRPWKKGPGQLRPQAQSQPRPVACADRCGARGAPAHAAGPSSRTGNLAR